MRSIPGKCRITIAEFPFVITRLADGSEAKREKASPNSDSTFKPDKLELASCKKRGRANGIPRSIRTLAGSVPLSPLCLSGNPRASSKQGPVY